MASRDHPLRVIFFPMALPGHLFPMLDIAKLFGTRGATVTVLAMPATAATISTSLTGNQEPISIVPIDFPSSVTAPSPDAPLTALFSALPELTEPFHRILTDLRPNAAVTDSFLPWTADVAASLGVPRLIFHGIGFFPLCIAAGLARGIPDDTVDAVTVVLPGLPHRFEVLRSQLPDAGQGGPPLVKLFDHMQRAEETSYGVVVNSFYELETEYADSYRKVMGRKAWHLGPVSLSGPNVSVIGSPRTDGQNSVRPEECLRWLDGRPARSVVYVSLGSLGCVGVAQLWQLALGLGGSGIGFLWVVNEAGEGWPPQGFLQRVEGKGLLISGWAPQRRILCHPAVGGFVAHCGWNSLLEAIGAGVPMITWPLFAEQFFNQKLVVGVLRIGVAVGAKKNAFLPEKRMVVTAAEVARALKLLIDEAKEIRRRITDAKEMAVKAIAVGGSSYVDLENLMEELIDFRTRKSTVTLVGNENKNV